MAQTPQSHDYGAYSAACCGIFCFGIFCLGPFKLLQILFYKNIFLVESNCWAEHKNVEILDNIVATRGSTKKIG